MREILDEVDRLAEELIELCRSLVRINTVNPYAGAGITGIEGDGQAFIQPLLVEMGGQTQLFEPPADIFARMGAIGPKDRQWKGRPNLVTRFDLGPGKRIIINSHMDTVGVADMDFDPFCADLRNGTIFGRGSSDDKGGIAMGIIAIKAVLKFADAISGTIIHQSVVDEECSGSGAGTLACCLEGYDADEAIVIDGQGLTVTRGCQGCLTADVTVLGKGGHAALGGVNAIDKAVIITNAIDRFKRAREANYPDCLVNLGIFNAGTHAAVVPASAKLSLNIVYAIEEALANEQATGTWDGSSVRRAFADAIHEAGESDDWMRDHPAQVEWVKDLVPFETPEDAPVVRGLCTAYQATLAEAPEVDIMNAWGDAANMMRYGGVPAVFFGPGTPGKSHAQDETVEVDDLVKGAKVIAAYLYQQLAKQS